MIEDNNIFLEDEKGKKVRKYRKIKGKKLESIETKGKQKVKKS